MDAKDRPAGLKVPERSMGQLAKLVSEVARRLDTPVDELLYDAVARCNLALESCLELQREREAREREDPVAAARDELTRLAQLLTTVDRSDAVLVMRQIRRVLGRFDAYCQM